MGQAPSPEARAIAAASIKSAPIGASIVVILFFAVPFLDGATLDQLLAFWWMIGLALILASAAGVIATGLCLLLFGSVIARISRAFLASSGGLGFAVGNSLAVTFLIGALLTWANVEWRGAMLLCLPYAIPAAILYRREILLERVLT